VSVADAYVWSLAVFGGVSVLSLACDLVEEAMFRRGRRWA